MLLVSIVLSLNFTLFLRRCQPASREAAETLPSRWRRE
jgi:hypothetical protein